MTNDIVQFILYKKNMHKTINTCSFICCV